jgi:hypothetical protein
LAEALTTSTDAWVDRATQDYLDSNRELLKTRLIDASESLHSELDRPDAEATFRMALWPPLTTLIVYLALEVSPWWWFALVVPALLVWQWISLRRKANDKLVAAFVARDELGGQAAAAEIRKNGAPVELGVKSLGCHHGFGLRRTIAADRGGRGSCATRCLGRGAQGRRSGAARRASSGGGESHRPRRISRGCELRAA